MPIRRPGSGLPREFDIDTIDGSPETARPTPHSPPVFIEWDITPLLLLPLRLEYRIVSKQETKNTVNDKSLRENLREIKDSAPLSEYEAERKKYLKGLKISPEKYETLETANVSLNKDEEIWFRWYPDESFSEKGIEPINSEEEELLNEFILAIQGEKWWNIEKEKVNNAWQHFANHVGGERAVYLLRSQEQEGNTTWESRIGRISALPERVALFSLNKDNIELLIEGKNIPPNKDNQRSEVSYTYDALEEGSWLANFNTAIELGMGVKIQDEDTRKKALTAEWIIAVGLYSGSATDEIETMFQDRIANGEFEFLTQDSPTNNSVDDISALQKAQQDLNVFLKKATCFERRKIPSSDTSSSLMQDALGISKPIFDKAINADNQDLEDARAMFRVIGPALLDGSVDGITPLEGIDEDKFIEALLSSLSARGILSPFRSGRNAYGIVTMTDIDKYQSHSSLDDDTSKVQNFVRDNCKIARVTLPESAAALVPVIKPEDEDAANNLEEILKTHRTSVRIDVATNVDGDTAPIGCPYIESIEPKPQHKASTYLRNLRTKTLSELVDPTEANPKWSLLYRLARQTLTRNFFSIIFPPKRSVGSLSGRNTINPSDTVKLKEAIKRMKSLSANNITDKTIKKAIESLPQATASNISRLIIKNNKFSDALRHLESISQSKNGHAKLEMLLLETVDLFQHRIDAWATGLAYERLRLERLEGKNALNAGYYGFISKLRHNTSSKQKNEYIQTPSLAQATSAAIMRSAYLRHKTQEDNAFEIDLRSSKALQALSLLDLLKKGLSLGEALGMQGERWLQDNEKSKLILSLRSDFPIKNTAIKEDQGKVATDIRRVFDGLSLINAKKIKSDFKKLKAKLEESLDALSDLIVAEAIHHRAMGAGDVANAWLQVLSGSPVPGEPIFLKTQRQGQASSHRVVMGLIPQAIEHTGLEYGSPRSIAEPAISRLAEQLLPEYDNAKITLTLMDKDTKSTLLKLDFYLKKNLYMYEIDLVIGGKSELYSRTKHAMVFQLISNPSLANGNKLSKLLDDKAIIKLELDSTHGAVVLKKASLLQKNIQSARSLEPSDLNAAALPENKLTESNEIALIKDSISELKSRIEEMQWRLKQVTNRLITGRIRLIKLIKSILSGIPHEEILDAIERNKAALEDQRRITATALWKASYWSEPSALQTFSIYEAIQHTDLLENRLLEVENQLLKKNKILAEAFSKELNFKTLSDAKSTQKFIISAMKKVLDGDALVILPSYSVNEHGEAITPLLNLTSQSSSGTGSEENKPTIEAANTLSYWGNQREKIKYIKYLTEQLEIFSEYQVDKRATNDDKDSTNNETKEQVSPRDIHHGIFLIEPEWISQDKKSGLVIDEWVSKRPSEVQTSGLAVNYNTPQAESPHALLLCIPPDITTNIRNAFTELEAASMVKESIAWMKIRAMSTSDKLFTSLLPNANQVSYKKTGNKHTPRIPKQQNLASVATITQPWFIKEGGFTIETSPLKVNLSENKINEKIGFSKSKE